MIEIKRDRNHQNVVGVNLTSGGWFLVAALASALLAFKIL